MIFNKALKITLLSILICLQADISRAQAALANVPFKQADYIRMYGSLGNTFSYIKKDKAITVAYLGGSITQNPGWRDKVCHYLEETYPQTKFTFIHAGIGSLGSLPHAFRLENDVLSKGKVDLLFYESAVNDQVNGTDSVTQVRSIEGVIRHALAENPSMDVVMMAFADQNKLADYKKGAVPGEVDLHQRMAEYYHLPFINLAKEVYDRIEKGEFTWKDDFKDLHPSPFGQEIYFQAIKAMLHQSDSLYSNNKPVKKRLPARLDKYSYSGGIYIPVTAAEKLNGFLVNPSWHPEKGGTRPGFVDVPVLEGNKPGDSFELRFKGNAVGICIASGYDAGKINYTIDGGRETTLDLSTKWSKSLHLPWYLILGDPLRNGNHVLKVRIPADIIPANSACRIVHFLVNSDQ
jgi:sialidase-1